MELPRFASATADVRPHPGAWAFSLGGAKIISLARHGQGVHNVAAALHGARAYAMSALLDADLDATGVAQARALGEHVRAQGLSVELVLVSPLRRALRTATEAFPPSPNAPPMIAVELCREACGLHCCDERRPISVQSAEFPRVDFSRCESNADTLHNVARRETVREVALRADLFLDVLRDRPERHIFVVSHGVFLESLLTRCSLMVPDSGAHRGRFENAELRSIVMGAWQVRPHALALPGAVAAATTPKPPTGTASNLAPC